MDNNMYLHLGTGKRLNKECWLEDITKDEIEYYGLENAQAVFDYYLEKRFIINESENEESKLEAIEDYFNKPAAHFSW